MILWAQSYPALASPRNATGSSWMHGVKNWVITLVAKEMYQYAFFPQFCSQLYTLAEKTGLQYPDSTQNRTALLRQALYLARWDVSHQGRDMPVIFELGHSKIIEVIKKPAASWLQNTSDWMGDVRVIASREKAHIQEYLVLWHSLEKFPLALSGAGFQQLCCIRKSLFKGTNATFLNAEQDCSWSGIQSTAIPEADRMCTVQFLNFQCISCTQVLRFVH